MPIKSRDHVIFMANDNLQREAFEENFKEPHILES